MAATPGTVERRVVHLTGRAALGIVGTIVVLIVLRGVFVAAHRPISWAVACSVAAILLDPIVDRLAVHIRRVPAVLLTFLAIGAIGVGTAYLAADSVQHAIDRLERAAPQAAGRIEDRDDRVGSVAQDFELEERVTSFVEALSDRTTDGSDVLRSTAGTAPSYLVCAILTIFLMTYGPRIAKAALEQDPDEDRRQRIADVVGPAVARARTGILWTAAIGFTVGVAVAGVAQLLDLPAAAAIGLTAGVLTLLPHVGIALGSVPLLLMSLGFKSSTTTLLLVALVVALQVVDSRFARSWVAKRSVEIGLFVPFVVALLGYEVYGIGGAAYGVVIAIGGLAVLDELEAHNARRIASAAKVAKAARKRAPAKKAAKRAPAKATRPAT